MLVPRLSHMNGQHDASHVSAAGERTGLGVVLSSAPCGEAQQNEISKLTTADSYVSPVQK